MIQLFYKAWLETRARFVVGLIVFVGLSMIVVFSYPPGMERLATWAHMHPTAHRPWWLDRELHEYAFYIWHRHYRGWFRDAWILSAVLFAIGGLTQESAKGSVAFSLSLPAQRKQFTLAYASVALAELLCFALSPAAILPAVSSYVDGNYSASEALSHGVLLFVAGVVIFGFTSLVASLVPSPSVPVVVGVASVVVLGTVVSPYDGSPNEPTFVRAIDIFRLMSGPADLSGHSVSWVRLIVCVFLFLFSFFLTNAVVNSRDYR